MIGRHFLFVFVFLSVPFPFVKSYFLRNPRLHPIRRISNQENDFFFFLVFNFLPAIRTQLINSTESNPVGKPNCLERLAFLSFLEN